MKSLESKLLSILLTHHLIVGADASDVAAAVSPGINTSCVKLIDIHVRKRTRQKQRNRAKKGITKHTHTDKTTRTCDPKY